MSVQQRNLKAGYRVASSIVEDESIPSETYSAPLKVAEALDLFYDLGILGKGRGVVRVLPFFPTPQKKKRRETLYEINLPELGNIFVLESYANQALMLKNRAGKKQAFDAVTFKRQKVEKASKVFKAHKKRMTARMVGAWVLYSELIDPDFDDEYLLSLAASNVSILNGVRMAQQNIPAENFMDMGDIPESWVNKLLGD